MAQVQVLAALVCVVAFVDAVEQQPKEQPLHVLFALFPVSHTAPFFPLAAEVLARKGRITFIGLDESVMSAKKLFPEARGVIIGDRKDIGVESEEEIAEIVNNVAGMPYALNAPSIPITLGIFVKNSWKFCEFALEPLRALMQEDPVDVLVVTPMFSGAYGLGEILDVPTVGLLPMQTDMVMTALEPLYDSEVPVGSGFGWLGRDRTVFSAVHNVAVRCLWLVGQVGWTAVHNYQRMRHGLWLQASTHDSCFAHPLLIPLVPEVGRPVALPSNAEWIGPLLHPRLDNETFTGALSSAAARASLEWVDAEVAQGRRILYIAFGSQLVPDARLRGVMELAIASLTSSHAVSVLWSLKGATSSVATMPHVRVEAFVAQKAVLARRGVGAFMSHGGANSVSEALTHAVPLLLVPFFGDQPSNAAALEDRGAALVLSKFVDDPSEIVAAAVTLVNPSGSFQNVAQRLQAAMLTAGGVTRAADTLLRSAQRDPLLSSRIMDRFRPDASFGFATCGLVSILATVLVLGVVWGACYCCLLRCCFRSKTQPLAYKKSKAV
eukprot:CAMPEP_0181296938 /NCGR_PEP_ID=MMETSP1101-20121128/4968_1 /TAXON_ID=46948 /ORGANISM="Rhodomonas abbreviata, Strain Caron Lab Isolate" /LENGTH=550 /DNA_ID=CAMNT_0023401831 /DNA_START=79 /DNA_END=1731 /DNA_ORIENTATION=+